MVLEDTTRSLPRYPFLLTQIANRWIYCKQELGGTVRASTTSLDIWLMCLISFINPIIPSSSCCSSCSIPYACLFLLTNKQTVTCTIIKYTICAEMCKQFCEIIRHIFAYHLKGSQSTWLQWNEVRSLVRTNCLFCRTIRHVCVHC